MSANEEIKRVHAEHFSGVYRELIELIGYDHTILLHNHFGGQYVTFPKRILSEAYVYEKIRSEYDGENARDLARKYDYSYSWIMKILKKS